jgi:hypothetical protein
MEDGLSAGADARDDDDAMGTGAVSDISVSLKIYPLLLIHDHS